MTTATILTSEGSVISGTRPDTTMYFWLPSPCSSVLGFVLASFQFRMPGRSSRNCAGSEPLLVNLISWTSTEGMALWA